MGEVRDESFVGARDTPQANNPRVLVIIPAYNEQDCILSTVHNITEAGYDYVVINDGSTDNTLALCRKHNINVLDLPLNLGIGGAVQTGHKYARYHGYDIDVQFDGDGQHDVRFLPSLVNEVLNGSDIVIGSRFLSNTGGFKSSAMRRIGKTWIAMCLRLFSGVVISDPTSGFRACGKQAINLFCNDYSLDYPEPESIATSAKVGLSIKEIPVEMRERQGGVSSISPIASIYYMIKVTLAIMIASFASSRKG